VVHEGAAKPRRRMRKLMLFMVLVAAFCTAALAYVWSERRELVSDQVRLVLARAGIETFDFEIADVGLSYVLIKSLRIGDPDAPDLSLRDLVVRFDLGGLINGHVKSIEIKTVGARIGIGSEGVRFGALDPLFETQSSSDGATILVDSLFIEDAKVLVSTSQGEVDLQGGIQATQSDTGWQLEPTNGCVEMSADLLQAGAVAIEPFATEICLADGIETIDWPLSHPLSIATKSLPIVLRGDHGELILSSEISSITAEVREGNLAGARVRAMARDIALPGVGVSLSDVVFSASLNDGSLQTATWTLEGGHLKDLSRVPRFAPVRIAGDGSLSTETVHFNLLVSDQHSLTFLLSIIGDYLLVDASADAVVNVGPLLFGKTGLQPQKIIPALKGVITNVVGSVAGEGRIAWRDGKLRGSATVQLNEVGLSTVAARIDNVSGTVEFAGLVPPMTAPEQTVTVGSIDAGFQLNNGTVGFAINENGSVQIERAVWPFAGGSIFLSSGLIEPGAATQELVLDVEDVDLASLIGLLNLNGVSGTGQVSGRVPVTIRDGNPIITGGQLSTSGPGQLAYIGEGTGAIQEGQSALLFQALENFQYTGLTLSLDGNAQDRLTVKLNLAGANPELYDGYPFVININTEASFAELLRSATLGTNAIDIIRENGAIGHE